MLKKKAFFEYTGSVSIVCAINGLIVQLDDLWNSITIGYWIGTVENLVYIFIYLFIYLFLGELKRLNDINFNKSLLIIDYINNLDYSPYYINFTDKNQPILN